MNEETLKRFWDKVKKTETCWLWTGSKNDSGHGNFWNKKIVKAHRVSWEIYYGPVPEKLQVCHKCDIPRCVNPEHLFLGTQRDNIRDCWKKGRASWIKNKGLKLLND